MQVDKIELERWPGTFSYDTCGGFQWRCQAPEGCSEPCHSRTLADQEAGEVYCRRHTRPGHAAAA